MFKRFQCPRGEVTDDLEARAIRLLTSAATFSGEKCRPVGSAGHYGPSRRCLAPEIAEYGERGAPHCTVEDRQRQREDLWRGFPPPKLVHQPARKLEHVFDVDEKSVNAVEVDRFWRDVRHEENGPLNCFQNDEVEDRKPEHLLQQPASGRWGGLVQSARDLNDPALRKQLPRTTLH